MSTESLARLSDNLVYAAMALYAVAMIAYAGSAVSHRLGSRQRPLQLVGGDATAAQVDASDAPGHVRLLFLRRLGLVMLSMAIAFHLGAVVARASAAERAPWANLYEFLLVITLMAAGAFLVLLRREPAVESFGVWLVGLVLLGLGLAIAPFYTPVSDLIPVLDSYWLVIHVAAAMLAGGVFVVGGIAAALQLLKSRHERRGGRHDGYLGRLPASSTLDRIAHSTALFALPIWTFTVIAGAIWAENAWGRYWGWDPKETWAFITWVFYAAYLHAQSTAGWRGNRAAWLNLAGLAAFLFNFFGVNIWISGLHSYAGL